MKKILFFGIASILLISYKPVKTVPVIDYDIVYARCPRFGDTTPAKFQDVWNPTNLNPGCDLVLLHPNGSEEILVPGGLGSVADLFVSFDATKVYFTSYPNLQPNQIGGSPYLLPYPNQGSDIAVVNVATKVVTKLTTHTGIELNMDPTPISGGKIGFVSSRTGQISVKGSQLNTQLYTMDEDGQNVVPTAPMSLTQVLHPFQLKDGRVCFSTQESQGVRDSRLWGYWCVWPDGRHFEPLDSAFDDITARHFATQLSNEDIVEERYYNANNQGFGAYLKFPKYNGPLGKQFGSPNPSDNPLLPQTIYPSTPYWMRFPFQAFGTSSLTPFTHGDDRLAPTIAGVLQGKVTHPSAAPHNDLLTVWSANSPAANMTAPATADAGLYLIKGGAQIQDVSQLILIKNDPNYNELWPRALVNYKAIYGVDQPDIIPFLPNDGTGHASLKPGTPFGLFGSSGVYLKQSAPYTGIGCGNCNIPSSNWQTQGSDAGVYTNADIDKIRIITEEPTPYNLISGPPFVSSHAHERLAILGEIPLRKFVNGQPVLDPNGDPDTSFLIKLNSDTPFTVALIDNKGMTLTMAQTWHQVKAGELHADCGGCHFHNGIPLAFEKTVAGQPNFTPADLTTAKLKKVEFLRDIRPILQSKCVSCHKGGDTTAPGLLDLNNQTPVTAYRFANAIPGDYARLAANFQVPSKWGIPPLVPAPWWGGTNASRYVQMMQARRSLLIWKLYGARLDGQTNQSDPTSAPFSVGTVDHSQLGLTADEKLLFVQWIDLGCLVGAEVLDDTLRPTITVTSPRQNQNQTVNNLSIGIADSDSGLNIGSFSVMADIAIGGKTAGTNLVPFGTFNTVDGIWTWPVNIVSPNSAHITVAVKDNAGLVETRTVRFNTSTGPVQLPAPTGITLKATQVLTDSRNGQKVIYPPWYVWNPVPGAVRYEIQITFAPNGQTDVAGINRIITPDYPAPVAANGGGYTIKIRGCSNMSVTIPCDGLWGSFTYSR